MIYCCLQFATSHGAGPREGHEGTRSAGLGGSAHPAAAPQARAPRQVPEEKGRLLLRCRSGAPGAQGAGPGSRRLPVAATQPVLPPGHVLLRGSCLLQSGHHQLLGPGRLFPAPQVPPRHLLRERGSQSRPQARGTPPARPAHLGFPTAPTFIIAWTRSSPGVTRTKRAEPTPAHAPRTAREMSALRRNPIAHRTSRAEAPRSPAAKTGRPRVSPAPARARATRSGHHREGRAREDPARGQCGPRAPESKAEVWPGSWSASRGLSASSRRRFRRRSAGPVVATLGVRLPKVAPCVRPVGGGIRSLGYGGGMGWGWNPQPGLTGVEPTAWAMGGVEPAAWAIGGRPNLPGHRPQCVSVAAAALTTDCPVPRVSRSREACGPRGWEEAGPVLCGRRVTCAVSVRTVHTRIRGHSLWTPFIPVNF